MNSFILVCLVSLFALGASSDLYTDKYDNIDVDEVMNNIRLLTAYVDCLLDKGPCTPEGKALKEHVPDALETECSKCSESQKAKTRKVMKELINHHPDMWNELVAKYDSAKKYSTKYEKELKEIQA